ncbi:MAG: hypothetical protein HY319_32235 [Armatimonadetes bacterium]|nr:hypothetical protein [Armatimonadota bacterium]
MTYFRRALVLVIVTLLAATGPALSGSFTSGSVLYKGKTSKVQSCRAVWYPKDRELALNFGTDPKGHDKTIKNWWEQKILTATFRFKGTPS